MPCGSRNFAVISNTCENIICSLICILFHFVDDLRPKCRLVVCKTLKTIILIDQTTMFTLVENSQTYGAFSTSNFNTLRSVCSSHIRGRWQIAVKDRRYRVWLISTSWGRIPSEVSESWFLVLFLAALIDHDHEDCPFLGVHSSRA